MINVGIYRFYRVFVYRNKYNVGMLLSRQFVIKHTDFNLEFKLFRNDIK